MALNALTLSVSNGIQGKSFKSAVSGMTPGNLVEVMPRGAPGFGYSNGFLSNPSLSYDVNLVILRERNEVTGENRTTQLIITAISPYALQTQASTIDATYRTYRTGAVKQGDGSEIWYLFVEGQTGATLSAAAGTVIPVSISGTPPAGIVSSAYSFTPTTANGSGTKSFALTGTLPTGLNFSTTTGAITGTPTTVQTVSGLNITVTDSSGSAALGAFSIAITAALSISGTPGSATIGSAYSFTPTAAGGSGTRTFSYSGTSLAGFGLSFSTTTGAITGTVSGSPGTISGTITVTDSSGSANLPISVTVSASLAAATATVTVNPTSNLMDHAIFQRDTLTGGGQGVGQGAVPIAMTAVTVAGTIHARCSSGGATRGDMQAEFAAGTIAATGAQTVQVSGVDARLGWFYLDILDSSGTWQNGTVLIGMGDLTIGTGQSLMGGFVITSDMPINTALSTGTGGAITAPNPNTRVIATNDLYSPTGITGVVWSLPADGLPGNGVRPGAGCAAYLHWMAVNQGCNHGFVSHGISGSYQSAWQWTPTGANNALYTQLTRFVGLINGKWRFQFWWQGHADSDTSAYTYQNDMDYREFGASGVGGYTALNSYPRANVVRIVNTIPNLFLGPYYYGPMRNAQRIRVAGKAWCAAKNDGINTNGIYVEMPGLSEPGDPHPGQLGHIEATKCIMRALYSDNLGPKLLSATRDPALPNDLILTFQQTGTDFQLIGNWWKRVAVYISGSTLNYVGCSTGSRISATQLRVTLTAPVGGGTWGDADAFDIIMGAPWDGDLSSDPSGTMIRDNRTDGFDSTNGRPFQTGTTPITAVALNGAGTHTATANYPATAALNKTGYIAPSSINDLVMTSAAYDSVEHKTGFGFPLIGGRGVTRLNQVAANNHGMVSSSVPMTLVARIKAPTPGTNNRTIFSWNGLGIAYSSGGKIFGSVNGGGSAIMASACTVGSVYWVALVGSTTGTRLYTCIEGGSPVLASALAATSKYSIANGTALVGASGTADFFAIAGSSIFDVGVYLSDTVYVGGSGSFSPPSVPLTGFETNLIYACPLTLQNDPSLTGVQADLVRAV